MTISSDPSGIDFETPHSFGLMSDQAAILCQHIIAANSKSFSFAAQFLPRHARTDASILYAWCRRVDDAVDEVDAAEAPLALEILQLELDAIYSSTGAPLIAHDPILIAFKDVIHRHSIPKYYPQELLKGMEMDVKNITYESLSELYQYCFRVASVVGLMMCHILKIRDDRSLFNAAHLGIAMQLTNICRDVSEDWSRERLYLPRELLTSSSLSVEEHQKTMRTDESSVSSVPSTRSRGQRFHRLDLPILMREPARRAIHELLRLADIHYRSGYQGIKSLPLRAGFAIQAAGMIYQDIGRIIRENECDPNQPRAITSKPRKVYLALLSLSWCALMSSWRGFRSVFRRQKAHAHTPAFTLQFDELYSDLTNAIHSIDSSQRESL